MSFTISYGINSLLYNAPETEHKTTLITTEYRCGNELLVHLQIGKRLCARLNSGLSDLLAGSSIENEQFLFKKTYNHGNPELITRSTFDAKIGRFDVSRTEIEREILEEYEYSDKNGSPCRVHIVITELDGQTSAAIDFEDTEQYKSFVPPAWLIGSDAV